MTKGFFALRDKSSGGYLSGRYLTSDDLVEFGTKIAIYRTDKAAIKAAKDAISSFLSLKPHWENKNDWGRKNYGGEFTGVEVIQLFVTEGSVVELVK